MAAVHSGRQWSPAERRSAGQRLDCASMNACSISDKDEAAGSSPARPTIPGLTWGNACPLAIRSWPLPRPPAHSGLRTHPCGAVLAMLDSPESVRRKEPRRRRGHGWSRSSRWAMAAACRDRRLHLGEEVADVNAGRLLSVEERLVALRSWVFGRRLRVGMPLGVGQGSRSTPAVRPYRRRRGATTTR